MNYFTKINCSTIFSPLNDAKVTQVPVLIEIFCVEVFLTVELGFPCSLSVKIVVT